MPDITFRVRCSGAWHRVLLHDDSSLSYPDHSGGTADVEEMVAEAKRPAILDILAGLRPDKVQIIDGCALILCGFEAGVRVAHYPDRGVRTFFATLHGRRLGAALKNNQKRI